MAITVTLSSSSVPAVNIKIEKGTDYEEVIAIKNLDGSVFNLTGYTGVSKIRKFPESATSSSFTVGFVTSAGQVVLSMGKTTTSNLANGRNYYDILLTSSENKTIKRIEGMALITPSVSV